MHREKGQSLTELAMTLPILLLVLLGTLDLGQLYFAYVSIQNAAREGAREGSVNPKDNNSLIEKRVQQEAANSGVIGTDITITPTCYVGSSSTPYPSCSSAAAGDTVRVRVSYNFKLVTSYLFSVPYIPMSDYADMVIIKVQ